MGHLFGKDYAVDHILEVAKSIVLAVHKAPQITGKTEVETEIIWGDELDPILAVMEPMGLMFRFVLWDYETIKRCRENGESPVIIAIGAKVDRSDLGWNCGACGWDTCKEFNAYAKDQGSGGGQLGGPCCNWKSFDYSMAADWACAAAWHANVENRIMGSLGIAMNMLGYMPDCNIKLGLALGPPREMVYYSRDDVKKVMSYELDKLDMIRCIPWQFEGFPGGGNPMYKIKDDWWAPPDFINVGYSEMAMDGMQKILFEIVPEIVDKYSGAVEARYKKVQKTKKK